jgi:hypothetical protein
VPVLADNEMVVHGDAERARDLDDRLRHLDVGARRGGIAGGMVVHRPPCLSKALRYFTFSPSGEWLGARIEGGTPAPIAKITSGHARSGSIPEEHCISQKGAGGAEIHVTDFIVVGAAARC